MAKKTWTLTDVDRGHLRRTTSPSAPTRWAAPAAGYSVTKRTLHGGLRDGRRRGRGRQRRVPLRRRAHPRHGPLAGQPGRRAARLAVAGQGARPSRPSSSSGEPSGLGWLDGFDELLVRCGLESNGAPEFNPNGSLRYPLHGKIANMPGPQGRGDDRRRLGRDHRHAAWSTRPGCSATSCG